MVDINIIPGTQFETIRNADIDQNQRVALIADMCRANALAAVKRAGSGHLGSSFSSLDIVATLYYSEMNVARLGIQHPDRDVYFSSKGHDVPGLYAVLYSLGMLEQDQLLNLRRLSGPSGHPDVSTPGMEANTGSLGMGISKGKGMAWAKQRLMLGGRIFVMTGDGEFQEGQIYEAFQTAAHQQITNLIVIVDHNKVQSDKRVSDICDLRDLDAKCRAFGWHALRCDGHDVAQLREVFKEFRAVNDKPKILIADTVKGRGVSFMEHPAALKAGGGLYRWHAGAPDDETYIRALKEITDRIESRLEMFGLPQLELEHVPPLSKEAGGVSSEYVAEAFGEELVEIAGKRPDIVVLDADLAADCRIRRFEMAFPDRFIENGIAEQDMVSMAGGLALQGLLPVVNSFAAFLSSRANEQIYTNACEQTRIIYVEHYSGLIPAGPGKSHQSIRDISLLAALPNLVILQPCNAMETRMALRFCVEDAADNCVLRLVIGPSPRIVELPETYKLSLGRGVLLRDGRDAVIFAYGPVMVHEALRAAEHAERSGISLKVVNMPWLNRVDREWLCTVVDSVPFIFVLEDHCPVGGLGDFLLKCLADYGLINGCRFRTLGVEGFPAWGRPGEVLRHHGLDGESIAEAIRHDITRA
jgi:transketolase